MQSNASRKQAHHRPGGKPGHKAGNKAGSNASKPSQSAAYSSSGLHGDTPRRHSAAIFSDAQAAAAEQVLQTGLQQLGLAVPPAAPAQLIAYLRLLVQWNHVYNLTAVRDPADMTLAHLLDSLAAVPALQRHCGEQALRILDVGAGGGLPGVVWAAACPQHRITCVDTVAKKVSFVRQVAAEVGLPNLTAVHARVEELGKPGAPASHAMAPFPLITARAFASLSDIVRLTQHLLAPGGVWLALKGQHPAEEIAALPPSIEVFHVEQLTVPGLDADRCIVWMRPRAPIPS